MIPPRSNLPLLVLLTSFLTFSCQSGPAAPPIREAQGFVEGLGLGYNLGNTLDATGGTRGNKISNFEIAWGAPMTTKAIFEDLKDRGFDTIRIPVAWSNLLADDDAIHPDLMNRVEEIVTMVLESRMNAIVNIHWDGGWITNLAAEPEQTRRKYQRIWTQVAERFRDYDQRLVFESLNEEGHFDAVWDRYRDGDPSPKKQRAFDLLNDLNQSFVDLVRSSGGQNGSRYLLIAGYATDIDLTCSPEFRMPLDPAHHSIVSVHYYTPSTFTILEKDADWGKAARSWGSDQDRQQLRADFGKLKARFVDRGIPAILGEYGATTVNKDPESVRAYLLAVAQAAWGAGVCPILWGGSDQHYDRRALRFTDPPLGNAFLSLSRTPRENFALPPLDSPSAPMVNQAVVEQAIADPVPTATETLLDEPVSGTSGNRLATDLGPVTVVVDHDTSYPSNDPLKGATVQMVEFQGRTALRVTKNARNEIRVAFVFEKPVVLAGKTTLEFSVAGFQGGDGSYNCGILYTEAEGNGARQGSFYVGRIEPARWVTVEANLAFDEQWGKNFSPSKEVYGLQFWTNQSKVLYITGLTVR